jgi:hypothetical protein
MNPSLTITLGQEPEITASGPISAAENIDVVINDAPSAAMVLSLLYNGQLIAFCDDFIATADPDQRKGILNLTAKDVLGIFKNFPWRSAISVTLTLFDAAGETMLLTSELEINAPGGVIIPEADPETVYTREQINNYLSTKADLVNGKIPSSQMNLTGKVKVLDNIAARNALSGMVEGDECWVINATADVTVTSGAARYLYNGAAWVKTAESESMDVITAWENIQNKPNFHAVATSGSYNDLADKPDAATKSSIGLGNVDNTSDASKPVSTAMQTALNGKSDTHTHPYIPSAEKGAVNGVATLGADGKVPSGQLPAIGETAPVTLGTSGTITIDRSLGNKFTCTPSAAVTFDTANFTNMLECIIDITNGSTNVSFPAAWNWVGGIPTLNIIGVDRIKLSAYSYNSVITIRAERIFADNRGGNDSYTKLLLNFNASPFVDSSSLHSTITTQAGVSYDTTTKKFGVGSMLQSTDNSNYIYPVWSINYVPEAVDFTVDFWLKTTQANCGYGPIDALTSWQLILASGAISTGTHSTSPTVVNDGNWHHVAWVRYNNTSNIYIDGTSCVSWADSTNYGVGSSDLRIGWHYIGNIDGVRISKGIARWTSNFAVPVSEYQ